jgi:hypothetical protein
MSSTLKGGQSQANKHATFKGNRKLLEVGCTTLSQGSKLEEESYPMKKKKKKKKKIVS